MLFTADKLGSERPSELPKVAQPVSIYRGMMRTLFLGSKFKTFSLCPVLWLQRPPRKLLFEEGPSTTLSGRGGDGE